MRNEGPGRGGPSLLDTFAVRSITQTAPAYWQSWQVHFRLRVRKMIYLTSLPVLLLTLLAFACRNFSGLAKSSSFNLIIRWLLFLDVASSDEQRPTDPLSVCLQSRGVVCWGFFAFHISHFALRSCRSRKVETIKLSWRPGPQSNCQMAGQSGSWMDLELHGDGAWALGVCKTVCGVH